MRLTLERAMGRASSTLSPGHRHVAAKVILLLKTFIFISPKHNVNHYASGHRHVTTEVFLLLRIFIFILPKHNVESIFIC